MIKTIIDLKNYFHDSNHKLNDSINVSTKIRNQWILNNESTIQNGRVYDIKFTNKGGGIWKAQLKSKVNKESKVDTKQLRGMVRERNAYRKLLNNCVKALNTLPNQKLNDSSIKNTYELVSTIEKDLNKFE